MISGFLRLLAAQTRRISAPNPRRSLQSAFLSGALLLGCVLLTPPGRAETAMQTYVRAMQPGANIGNSLDAIPTETSWGYPLVTQELIKQIKARGFKSLRIPVTWDTGNRVGPAPNYAIDPVWMNRVQQVVDWSLNEGLYVMLNMHHDSVWIKEMPTKHDAVLAEFKAIWSQIATRFRDYPNTLMFESINEPDFASGTDTAKMDLLNELNTAFFHIVRGSSGGNVTRPLVLPSFNTNSSQQWLDSLKATMTALNDPNLIATVHYYGFWPFSVNIAGVTTFNDDVIKDITTAVNNDYNTFVANGIPVVVGELGLLMFDFTSPRVERGEALKYFELITSALQSKGITWQLWGAGGDLNRYTYQWLDPEVLDYCLQSLSGRSTTADTDLIFLKNGVAVQDALLNLNLNGNTLTSLKDGSTVLSSSSDYALNGSGLTVKAGTLSKYASGAFGEKATLTVNTSAGLPWKVHVRYFDTPVLSAASGTKTGGLTIPTSFNGDLLATMEAVYASGGNAGPANWTSYKEFNAAFFPDYTKNTITLTKEFFAETAAGTIDLTFHFWSGQTVSYQIAVSGSNVTSKTAGSPPATPASAGAFASGASAITLSWLPAATGEAATGYRLERATDASFTAGYTMISLGGSSTSYVDASVAGNTKYYYRLSAINAAGASSPTAAFTATTPGATGSGPSMLVNIATRAFCGTGENVAIAGFVIGGTGSKRVLLRAVGPTLTTYGLAQAEVLADPTMQLYKGSTVIATNDDWGSSENAAEISTVAKTIGASSLGAGDTQSAALLMSLEPGAYTFIVNGKNNSTGIVLLEVYDADPSNTAAHFVNIATRAYSTTGSGVTIGGFVVAGARPKQVLIRSVGPTLESYGLARSSLLADPVMEVHQGAPLIAVNDNWRDNANLAAISTNGARIGASSIDSGDTKSSVLLAQTLPGAYTFIAAGKGGTSGIVIVEVYDAD
jgi:aryl-phospho-beta-D-glucosidase BglC (GH1 family)